MMLDKQIVAAIQKLGYKIESSEDMPYIGTVYTLQREIMGVNVSICFESGESIDEAIDALYEKEREPYDDLNSVAEYELFALSLEEVIWICEQYQRKVSASESVLDTVTGQRPEFGHGSKHYGTTVKVPKAAFEWTVRCLVGEDTDEDLVFKCLKECPREDWAKPLFIAKWSNGASLQWSLTTDYESFTDQQVFILPDGTKVDVESEFMLYEKNLIEYEGKTYEYVIKLT